MYSTGTGTTQSYKNAFKWALKAAEDGYPNAQFTLGYLYWHGQGFQQSYEHALQWYLKAADAGHPYA